jgi:iron complex transport system ATP-binding protein
MNAAPLLEAIALDVTIGNKRVCVDLNLRVGAGECWAILGGNGVGKTTLLHTLATLRPPAHGELLLDGVAAASLPRRAIAQRVGVLLQDYDELFSSTVLQTALLGRHPYLRAWEWEGAADALRAGEALSALGIETLAQRAMSTLSGGERRRAHLATLLTQDPRVFLLDEPTNHLDVHHQLHTLNLLRNIVQAHGHAMIAVLHDVNLAARFCDHALLLFGDGEVLHGATDTVVTADNLSRLLHHRVHALDTRTGRAFLPD